MAPLIVLAAVVVMMLAELWLSTSNERVLRARPGRLDSSAQATFSCTRHAFARLLSGTSGSELVRSGDITVEGEGAVVERLFGLFDTFPFWFPIVTP